MVTSVSSSSSASNPSYLQSTGASGPTVSTSTPSTASTPTSSTTSPTAAANITNILGAGSGIDTKALAANLVAAERAPQEAAINKNITKSQNLVTGLGGITSVLTSVQTAFSALKDTQSYNNITATNSQPNAFYAAADNTAVAGNHAVRVTSLAQPQRTLSTSTFSGPDATVNTSAMTLTIAAGSGSTAVTGGTISLAAGATPATVVAAINQANLGVSAYLMNTGSAYQVMMTGPQGAANSFSISSSDSTSLAFNSTALQAAGDAALTVDGVSITSSSNTIKDAIGGVTLTVSALTDTGSDAVISLQNDTSKVTTNIQSLVTAYNDAISGIKELMNPSSTLATYGATLVGNSTARSMQEALRGLVTAPSNTPTADGLYSSLMDIGITLDAHGVLTIDAAKLSTAVNGNFNDVVQLMTGNQNQLSQYDTATPSGIAGEANRTLTSLLSPTGVLATESANANTQIQKYKDDLTALGDRMTRLLARYTKQFAAMDSMVGQTKSTQTGLTSSFAGLMAMYTNK